MKSVAIVLTLGDLSMIFVTSSYVFVQPLPDADESIHPFPSHQCPGGCLGATCNLSSHPTTPRYE